MDDERLVELMALLRAERTFIFLVEKLADPFLYFIRELKLSNLLARGAHAQRILLLLRGLCEGALWFIMFSSLGDISG